MTCGMQVAPRMPTASRTLSVPSKPGTRRPWPTPGHAGSACSTWNPNATTMTPTKAAITASSRRNPRAWRARIPKAAMPVRTAAGKSGRPVSRLMPIAAPTNSAMSVAIAITSAWTQSRNVTRRGKRARHTSGRFRPVAIPSFALIDWISIAIRFAASTTQRRR